MNSTCSGFSLVAYLRRNHGSISDLRWPRSDRSVRPWCLQTWWSVRPIAPCSCSATCRCDPSDPELGSLHWSAPQGSSRTWQVDSLGRVSSWSMVVGWRSTSAEIRSFMWLLMVLAIDMVDTHGWSWTSVSLVCSCDCWGFAHSWVEFKWCGLEWILPSVSTTSLLLSDSFSWHENTRSAMLADLSNTDGVLGGFLAASSQRSSKNSFLPESWSGSSQSNWRNQILWLLVSITAPRHLQTLLEMRKGVFDSTMAILIQNLSIGTKIARLHGTTLLFPKRKDISTGFSWTKLRTWVGKWLN